MMNVRKRFLMGAVMAAILTAGGLGVAAERHAPAQDETSRSASGMHAMQDRSMSGMSMGGMMNMMGNCPVVGSNLPPRQQMRMQADMMRAMAGILDKYSAQAPAARHP